MARLLTVDNPTSTSNNVDAANLTIFQAAITSSPVHEGAKAYRMGDTPTLPSSGEVDWAFTFVSGTRYYARSWVRLSGIPATSSIDLQLIANGGTNLASLSLQTDGKIGLYDQVNAFANYGFAPALVADTWYLLELSWQITTTAGPLDILEARLNQTTFALKNDADLAWASMPNQIKFLAGNPQSLLIYHDQLAVNDTTTGTENSWPTLPAPVDTTTKPGRPGMYTPILEPKAWF